MQGGTLRRHLYVSAYTADHTTDHNNSNRKSVNSMPSARSTPTWRAYKRTAMDPAMARFCADYIW